jgi:hypothetical protein
MEKILIRLNDNTNGILNFDLKKILDTIKLACKNYSWYIYFIDFEHILKNIDRLVPLVESINEDKEETFISWENLYLIAESIKQIIDMDLEGKKMTERIFIKAIDSSFWEIETTNKKILECFSSNFKDVQITYLTK